MIRLADQRSSCNWISIGERPTLQPNPDYNGLAMGYAMLSPGIRILLVGNDFGCLIGHARALNSARVQAIVADPEELKTHVGTERFNLVVLCHTLSDLQRRIASEGARHRWSGVKVLQLLSSKKDFTSLGCALDDATQDNLKEVVEHVKSLTGIRSGA